MGTRVGTSHKAPIRAGALALAALFGTVAPGINPAVAAAAPAHAQAPGDGQQPRPPWAPPPLPAGTPLPSDNAAPPSDGYKRVENKGCHAVMPDAGPSGILKNEPWPQSFLRIKDAQDYVKQHSKYHKVGVDENNGQPMTVAVIDTGVSPHKFLKDHLKPGGDYVEKANSKTGLNGMRDCDGHGTEVAGIIAAKVDNPDVGFTGFAPDSQIVSIRQSSSMFQQKTKEELQKEEQARQQKAKEKAEKRKEAAEQKKQEEADARQQKQLDQLKRENEQLKRDKDKKKGGGKSTGSDTAPSQDNGGTNDTPTQEAQNAGSLSTLASAVMRAVKVHHAKVINMSIDACRGKDESYADENKLRAALKYAVEKGDAVPVVSAGNTDECAPGQNGVPAGNSGGDDSGKGSPPYPVDTADDPKSVVIPPLFSYDKNVLAVGAIDRQGGVANFSMHGPWVSVAAPGTDIYSLDPGYDDKTKQAGQFIVTSSCEKDDGKCAPNEQSPIQGTSFAAPYVSGLAVLVRQMNPQWSARDVMKRIEDTAQHPGSKNGVDQFVGHGVIDPMAALTAQEPEDFDEPRAKGSTPAATKAYIQPDNTPMTVALLGTAGGVAGLAITLFTMHALRRSRQSAK